MTKSPKSLLSVTLVSIVLLASALWVSTGQALPTSGTAKVATSTSLDKTTISVANSELDASDASDTHASLTTRLLQAMPHLEQALIIFTSVNGLLIVSGLLLLFVKERLHRQSMQPLASLRANRHSALDSTNTVRNKDIT